MVSHMLYIHLAATYTQAAAVAAVGIHFDACQGEAVEESIDRSQRTDKAAEAAVAERAGCSNDQHDHPFAGEQDLQLVEGSGIGFVLQKTDCPLQRPGRADVLAEARERNSLFDSDPDGNRNREHHQKHVFQIRKPSGPDALFDLGHGNLMQNLLNQSQRTQPSADRSSQNHTEQCQNSQYIPWCGVTGCVQCILQRTKRAACDRPRAGIAVEARNADALERP